MKTFRALQSCLMGVREDCDSLHAHHFERGRVQDLRWELN